MIVRRLAFWLTFLIGAAVVWAAISYSAVGIMIGLLCAGMAYAFISFVFDNLERARERAQLRGKVRVGTLHESELPPKLLHFPFWTMVIGAVYCAGTFALSFIVSTVRSNYGQTEVVGYLSSLGTGMGLLTLAVTIYTLVKFSIWFVTQSTEEAFTAAEALRRRKLKETIYAESDGDPLNVSDWRGDVSVGDDGELLDQSSDGERNEHP
jgi:hypothetical protein